jgi:AAA domain
MLRLDKVIKPWKESAALNDHINLYGFWNETAFLTKSGDVGMILSVPGVDYESLDRSQQEYAVKRLEAALKAFGPGFHVYQYLFKSNRPDIPFATYDDPIVAAAIDQRRKFFEAKRDHLYQVEIFYCILLEGSRSKTGVGTALARLLRDPEGAIAELKSQFTNDSMKKLLRTHIERDLRRLDQSVQAFARQLGDFMQIEILNQQGQFKFFRRLLNYDDWRVAGGPQSTQFLDYQVVNSDIEAERDHLRVGDHIVRVLTMKEAITETRPLVLDALLKIPANFYVVTEWTPLAADKARKEVNKRRRHFNMSKTGFVSQMGNDATKTTTLTVIRNVAESQGYQVEGFAPTSRAARQLNEAGIEAGTLQGFLARAANPDPGEQKHLYVVDESSLASTNQMREFLSRVGPKDRVLLVGDTRQHQGVEAGRPFEQLQEAGMRTAKLDEIVRQQDPALKSAVELLATGHVSAALDALQEQGRVKEIPNGEERIRAIAKSYVESPENTLIVSPDNASRRDLNVAVRHELKATGALAPEDHAFRVLVQRQDMTGAERSWASHYEINDVVRYTRGSKAVGIEAAAYASVVAINPSANQLTVEKANGELATYDPRRLTGVSVYQEVQREFGVGDRIQFTAPDKSLGVANRDMAVIEAIHPDNRLSVRLDNNRQIEFNPNEHRHLEHGYAVTSHSSQGLTAERVLVHADSSVYPDLLNSRFAYVSISRASQQAMLFTDDMAKLGPQLAADVSKTSALEINQGSSVGHGIGLGLGL